MAEVEGPKETLPTGLEEQKIEGLFEALKVRTELQAKASRPLGKGDPVVTARLKEVEAYIQAFLNTLRSRRPQLRLLEHLTDPSKPTKVEVQFDNAAHFYEAMTLSFSQGGIFIKSESILPIDSLLTMTIKLAEEAISFTVSAKVIWVNPRDSQGRPAGFGVKFYKLSSIQRQVLEDFAKGELPVSSLVHLSE